MSEIESEEGLAIMLDIVARMAIVSIGKQFKRSDIEGVFSSIEVMLADADYDKVKVSGLIGAYKNGALAINSAIGDCDE